MGLSLAFAVASTGLKMYAAKQGMNAAKAQGALASRQFDTQIKNLKLTATQNHNKRLAQLKLFQQANEAVSGVTGRDLGSDRSYKRILERAKKDTLTDVDRLRTQTAMQIGQVSFQDSLNKLRVQNKVNAYKFQMLGAVIGGASKAYPLMPNTGTGLGTVGYST